VSLDKGFFFKSILREIKKQSELGTLSTMESQLSAWSLSKLIFSGAKGEGLGAVAGLGYSV
jgi:hypothetical protein